MRDHEPEPEPRKKPWLEIILGAVIGGALMLWILGIV